MPEYARSISLPSRMSIPNWISASSGASLSASAWRMAPITARRSSLGERGSIDDTVGSGCRLYGLSGVDGSVFGISAPLMLLAFSYTVGHRFSGRLSSALDGANVVGGVVTTYTPRASSNSIVEKPERGRTPGCPGHASAAGAWGKVGSDASTPLSLSQSGALMPSIASRMQVPGGGPIAWEGLAASIIAGAAPEKHILNVFIIMIPSCSVGSKALRTRPSFRGGG